VAGVILHTDQGSEYTGQLFRQACHRLGIRQSMGRPGSALDNAAIEAWHSTLEFELRAREFFPTKAIARTRVAAWIDEYNRERRHCALVCKARSATNWPTPAPRRRNNHDRTRLRRGHFSRSETLKILTKKSPRFQGIDGPPSS
jgi:hypothetical protein